jgi:hypothetical protein
MTVAEVTEATSKPEYMKKVNWRKVKDDKEMDSLGDSAPSEWAGERMKNGNATKELALHDDSEGMLNYHVLVPGSFD